MIIRKVELRELQAVAELFDQYRIFYKKEPDIVGAKEFLRKRLEANESVIFGSFTYDGTMTGFTQLYPLFSSTRMQKFWLLNDLYVHKDFRKQGLSIALIEQAKVLCRESGACGMMLETAKNNLEGNQLYPKTGFNLDTDHNFYEWNVD